MEYMKKRTQLFELNTNDLKVLANSEQKSYRWDDIVLRFIHKAINLVYRENRKFFVKEKMNSHFPINKKTECSVMYILHSA